MYRFDINSKLSRMIPKSVLILFPFFLNFTYLSRYFLKNRIDLINVSNYNLRNVLTICICVSVRKCMKESILISLQTIALVKFSDFRFKLVLNSILTA